MEKKRIEQTIRKPLLCRHRKILNVMKWKILFIFFFSVKLSASSFSQDVKVTLELEQVSVKEFLKTVQQQTGINFLYNANLIESIDRVNVYARDKELRLVLQETLSPMGLVFVFQEGTVIIKKAEEKKQPKQKFVVGVVRDEVKNPLPGVTVQLKGLNVGTATDARGFYRIYLLDTTHSAALVFSFVGMETKVVQYNGRDTIDVVLKEDAKNIDEVVVTGYQTLKKRSQAGSISTVKAEDLLLNGSQTVEQALQGKVPGMMVMNRSGLTGTRQRVRVRGTSTLLGNAEPVWVVDGIIQEDPLPFKSNDFNNLNQDNMDMIRNFVGGAISWLNPNDIETVTVLKDAVSTAIYGVKAANGVIVISTKKGKAGRMSVSYTGNMSVTPRMTYNRLELMNSQERVAVSREAYEKGLVLADGGNYDIGYTALALAYKKQQISLDEFTKGAKELEKNNTDYFDILFRNAFSHNHTVSISGGSDKSTYHASIGISDVNNTAKGNDQLQYMANISAGTIMWDCLSVNFALGASYAETNAFVGEDPYSYASKTNRAIKCYNEDGSLFYYKHEGDRFLYNIVNELEQSGNKNALSTFNSSLALRWAIIDGLSYNFSLGYSVSNSTGNSWYTEQSHYISKLRGYNFEEYAEGTDKYKQSGLPHGGELNSTQNKNVNWTMRNQIDFTKVFNKVHSVSVAAGQEMRSVKQDGFEKKEYGYLHSRGKLFVNIPITINGTANSLVRNAPKVKDTEENYMSFYGTLSYMYDNRYALNASVRMDASNRFGQDRSTRYLPIWSVGARWNLGSEHFLEHQNLLSDMVFRFSYGWQGNVVTSVSPDLIAKINVSDSDGYVLTVENLPAPDLKWEKVQNLTLGIDYSLFSNKIHGSFDYYRKKTKDMIVNREVPYVNGVEARPINGGEMTNSGWDLGVSFIPVRTKDLTVSVGLTTGKVYNEVKSKIDPTGAWDEAVSGNLNQKGYPVSSFWAFRFVGLDPVHGGPLFDMEGAELEDASRDATLYMDYAGKMEPDFTAGLSLNVSYKTFTLSTSFYLSLGNQQFLAPIMTSTYDGIPSEYENMSKEWIKRWRQPGDEKKTSVPSLPDKVTSAKQMTFGDKEFYPYEMYGYSTARVVDAWFLKCSNIALSYTVPNKRLPSILQNLSVNCSITNPFEIVSKDFMGRDPEVALGSQPLSTTVSLGVSVSF